MEQHDRGARAMSKPYLSSHRGRTLHIAPETPFLTRRRGSLLPEPALQHLALQDGQILAPGHPPKCVQQGVERAGRQVWLPHTESSSAPAGDASRKGHHEFKPSRIDRDHHALMKA